MMTKPGIGAVVGMLVCLAAHVGAQSIDERAAAREIVARHGEAIVTVMGTLKAHMSRAGQDRTAPDQAVQASATVLDPSGLVVVSLSALDPGEIAARNPGLERAKVTMTTELVDLKIRLVDGTELPARMVLRDADLDLLFVRPVTEPPKPMPALSPSPVRLTPMDAVIIVQRFGESAGWKAGAAVGTVEVVVDKPRTLYVVAVTTAGHGIGASVFDIKGQFAGVLALRPIGDPKTYALTGMQGDALQALGMVRVVVPAADIFEVAKQATVQ
jgi:hypothetical protein